MKFDIEQAKEEYLFYSHNAKCCNDDKESKLSVNKANEIISNMYYFGYHWSKRKNQFIKNR